MVLMVGGTVNSKNNKEEKTREFTDMRMYHLSWNFLSQGCDMGAPLSMSLCSLLTTVPSTTNPHVLYVARHVNKIGRAHV